MIMGNVLEHKATSSYRYTIFRTKPYSILNSINNFKDRIKLLMLNKVLLYD